MTTQLSTAPCAACSIGSRSHSDARTRSLLVISGRLRTEMVQREAEWSREEIYYIAERAHHLYRQGRFNDAGILFEGLTAIDPDNVYCRKALAAVYMALKEYGIALRHLTAVLSRDRF